jgi:hypothetical protein
MVGRGHAANQRVLDQEARAVFDSAISEVRILPPQLVKKWPRFPLLGSALVRLCGRKLALTGLQRANLSGQSPVGKFQYPNLFAGDAVRECGDRFEMNSVSPVPLKIR